MSVARDDTAALESRPDVILDSLIGDIRSNLILHLHDPSQDFLVGKTVKRASQTVQSSSKRQHRTRQCRANQMGCMRRDIATLMIRVDRQVQSHQLDELLVLAVSHQMGEIVSVILVLDNRRHLAALVYVLVDSGGDGREFGNQRHGVFKSVFPVLFLIETLGVGLCKSGLLFQCSDGWGLVGSEERIYRERIVPWGAGRWDIGR